MAIALRPNRMQRCVGFGGCQGLTGAKHPDSVLLLQRTGAAPRSQRELVTLHDQVESVPRGKPESVSDSLGHDDAAGPVKANCATHDAIVPWQVLFENGIDEPYLRLNKRELVERVWRWSAPVRGKSSDIWTPRTGSWHGLRGHVKKRLRPYGHGCVCTRRSCHRACNHCALARRSARRYGGPSSNAVARWVAERLDRPRGQG
jgi:hypothetical protein